MIRIRRRFGWLAALTLMTLAPPVVATDTMRCGSRLVSVDARAGEVLAICGTPTYRDDWNFELPNGNRVSEVEEWTYNFGSNQLLRVLSFRNGRLTDIRTDGYGFSPQQRRCDPGEIVEGLSKYRLLASCGDPLTRQVSSGYSPLSRRDQAFRDPRRQHYVIPVYREEWIYNFGARYALRIVTLENGRVSEVENGERGSDIR